MRQIRRVITLVSVAALTLTLGACGKTEQAVDTDPFTTRAVQNAKKLGVEYKSVDGQLRARVTSATAPIVKNAVREGKDGSGDVTTDVNKIDGYIGEGIWTNNANGKSYQQAKGMKFSDVAPGVKIDDVYRMVQESLNSFDTDQLFIAWGEDGKYTGEIPQEHRISDKDALAYQTQAFPPNKNVRSDMTEHHKQLIMDSFLKGYAELKNKGYELSEPGYEKKTGQGMSKYWIENDKGAVLRGEPYKNIKLNQVANRPHLILRDAKLTDYMINSFKRFDYQDQDNIVAQVCPTVDIYFNNTDKPEYKSYSDNNLCISTAWRLTKDGKIDWNKRLKSIVTTRANPDGYKPSNPNPPLDLPGGNWQQYTEFLGDSKNNPDENLFTQETLDKVYKFD